MATIERQRSRRDWLSRTVARQRSSDSTTYRLRGTEPLEPRRVLATFLVTSGFDSGLNVGELRSAIFQANGNPGSDVIEFSPVINNINLVLGEIDIVDDLVINGATSNSGSVTIRSALSNSRIFNVDDTDGFANKLVSMNNLTLSNGNVTGAASNEGGGIRNAENLNLRHVTLSGNQADVGGGMANRGIANLRYVTITDNVAASGGGLANLSRGQLLLQQSSLERNQSSGHGGGLDAAGDGSVVVLQSTIAFNTAAANGGGLSFRGANAVLQNATIYGNQAGGNGGGLDLASPLPSQARIEHSTIVENSATATGGGLRASAASVVSLDQTVVANNDNQGAIASPDVRAESEVVAVFSLIGDGAGSGFQEARPDANGNQVGGSQTGPIDPLLQPLADNGGPTQTVRPQADSPVLDTGDPSFLGPPSFDQRGTPFSRVSGIRADVGAVERQQRDPDINADGSVDCLDVDSLVAAIAAGSNDPLFDFNDDGQVDQGDLGRWLELAAAANYGPGNVYLVGDANLDGNVDGSDFGTWNANKFRAEAAWCQGDFNADGVIDGSDFNLWNTNKFRSGLSGQSASAVHTPLPTAAEHAHGKSSIGLTTKAPEHRPVALPAMTPATAHDRFWSSFGQRRHEAASGARPSHWHDLQSEYQERIVPHRHVIR